MPKGHLRSEKILQPFRKRDVCRENAVNHVVLDRSSRHTKTRGHASLEFPTAEVSRDCIFRVQAHQQIELL